MTEEHRIRAFVESYYSRKIVEFGPVPRGVDWSSSESQHQRFGQLLSVCAGRSSFSLNDIGCGYGALLEVLDQSMVTAYTGYDVSAAMIEAAGERYAGLPNVRFCSQSEDVPVADFTVASGIFGVKGDIDPQKWWTYALETIDFIRSRSLHGFAFNMLTQYSDPERMRADLYYADPIKIFEHCRQRYSRWVALLHDYGLYEFTIRVRLA